MIDSVSIRSFKSLDDVVVELGVVNVFIGANGSGKSNLLEAVGVLGAAAKGTVDSEALLRRGVRPSPAEMYKSSFDGTDEPGSVRLAASSSSALYEVRLETTSARADVAWRYAGERLLEGATPVVDRDAANGSRLNPSEGLAALKAVELDDGSAAAALLSQLQRYSIYAPDTATLRSLRPDPQSREPVGLSGGRLAEAYAETCRAWAEGYGPGLPADIRDPVALVDWATEIAADSTLYSTGTGWVPEPSYQLDFTDKYMAPGRNHVSALAASEGALYLLFAMVLANHPAAGPVFAIDNFDHALNPRLARTLASEICQWMVERGDRQALLTSHNPLVLDGLPLQDDRVRLFAVDRSRRGRTVVARVAVNDAVLQATESGLPLSQQWVMGNLGGVPRDV